MCDDDDVCIEHLFHTSGLMGQTVTVQLPLEQGLGLWKICII